MLTTTRRFAKSWAAAVIIGLLIVGLVVVGVTDVFRLQFGTYVIKAGEREVSQQQFARIIDNLNERNAQMSGQRFTNTELVESGQHLQILEGLAGEESLFAWVWKVGIRPAADLVAEQLRSQTGFFDQVTGEFDEEIYAARLAEAGMTPADYERTMRDQIAAEHYVAGVAAGLRLPRIYGALEAAYAQETRAGRWVMLDPAAVDVPAPTDAQLTELLNQFADQVREPERRVVTLVRFTPAQAAEQVTVSDEDIQRRFEFARDSLGTPETRSFVTLTAPNAQVAGQIAQRLRAGEAPAAVGEALNIEPVTYDSQPRSAVADQRVAAAAFGLSEGAVSGPVQGELGLVVIKMNDVTAGRQASLEDHRAEIEQALRLEQARVRVTENVERYVQLREGGASMADAAEQTGGDIVTLPPFSAEGQLPNGQPMGAPEVLYQTAFDTAQGQESDIVDAGGDEYFAIRVDQITPARMPTVDELRGELTAAWRQRETQRLLQERANAIAGRIRGGEDIAAVAQAEGLTVVSRDSVGRNAGEGEDAPPLGVIEGLFGQGRGQVFSGPADQEGRFAVGVVDQVRAPTAAVAGRIAEQRRPALTGAVFQQELLPGIQTAAGEAVGVETFPDRARAALGVPPEEEPEGGE
ncbi:peptidylprolyl isomerase [Brevundimonas sp.]|uniref:peptidylprolyl isomerase n=1 Tax=Brevundimonas sp. TaxID=1871086 RepID=UPI0025CC4989|nr:peptidylprolyl isomerase [Brevundimonas sp.]